VIHSTFIVIPAKAGISTARVSAEGETPAFAGVTKKMRAAKIIGMARASLEIFA
jgi:hypothetical protein